MHNFKSLLYFLPLALTMDSFVPASNSNDISPKYSETFYLEKGKTEAVLVTGIAQRCSKVVVEPPHALLNMDPDSHGDISIWVDYCTGGMPTYGGVWPFGSIDSWEDRKEIVILRDASGGQYSCNVELRFIGPSNGPINFDVTWKILTNNSCDDKISKY